MSDDEVEALLAVARRAVEAREELAPQFVIPDGSRRWRVVAQDLESVGENDFGIPPKVFAYGAIGMLVSALGSRECYALEVSNRAVVVTVFADRRLEVHTLGYRRGEEGLVWEAPSVWSSSEPGPLGAALPLWRAVNREPAPMPPTEELLEDMRESGFVIRVEDFGTPGSGFGP